MVRIHLLGFQNGFVSTFRLLLNQFSHAVEYISELSWTQYSSYSIEDPSLLTEQEISRSWRNLFKDGEISLDAVTKAEALLEELRPESPLRHRLGTELEEIRKRFELATDQA